MPNLQNRLQVVTCYFNPIGYLSRYRNYLRFISEFERQGVNCLTIELAVGNQGFALTDRPNIVHVRGTSILWQKERLINVALSGLNQSTEFVAWVDCDLIFTNDDWSSETVKALEHFPIVQLFEHCIKLPKGIYTVSGQEPTVKSFALVTSQDPRVLAAPWDKKHGITGGAFAARRDLLEKCGIYEDAIAGDGDDFLAHAIYGDFDNPCLLGKMHGNQFLRNHYMEWATRFYTLVRGQLGLVRGDILHLWHGDFQKRRYKDRHEHMVQLGYNPYQHLVKESGMPLEWSKNAPEKLKTWLANYFAQRDEDD